MFDGCVNGAGSKPNINNGKYPRHKHAVDVQLVVSRQTTSITR